MMSFGTVTILCLVMWGFGILTGYVIGIGK